MGGISRSLERAQGLATKHGRPVTLSAQQSWVCSRLRGLVRGTHDKAFINKAYELGLTSNELMAMFATLWLQLQADRRKGTWVEERGERSFVMGLKPEHYHGSANKLLETGRKLVELGVIERAEVPGRIIIEMVHEAIPAGAADDDALGAGDAIEVS